jgi:ABC-type molybdate transport system substrate-binding protein
MKKTLYYLILSVVFVIIGVSQIHSKSYTEAYVSTMCVILTIVAAAVHYIVNELKKNK